MAKKEKPSLAGSLNNFKDTMLRASLSDYLYVNQTMVTINPKGNKIIIIPESELWLTMIQDEDMKKELTEANLSNPDDSELVSYMSYVDDIEGSSWISLDTDKLYSGNIIRVKVNDDFEYDIPINRDLLPLKLKKAEYKDISYKIIKGDELVLCIKKKFSYPIENAGFTMARIFKIT